MGDGILADGDVDPAGSGHCIFYDLTDVAEKRLDRDPDIAGVDHSFFLGYMNKFGLCLVDKEIINSSFISTVGNINWYCGYLVTVLFGGVYLLWWMGSEITWKRALLMGYVTIGFASLVTQGSSSGVVTLAVMLFVLFGMSVKDGRKMECFWQEMTLLSVACLITYILRSCNVLSQELPMEKVTDILSFPQ